MDGEGAFTRVVSSVVIVSGQSRFNLDSAVPRAVALVDLKMVSWVTRVRFEADTLALRWRTDGVAETTIQVRTLEDN